ncbi:FUSC family protein [Nonomuraea sp. NPDC050536]|uniref:FUSC family protein n=1 Tax=Nonomuraea sp. NPDC050536 TaxID=3364366 RepID=UPI0037CA3569
MAVLREARGMGVAALGMGVPVAWGVLVGHPALGALAAIGAMSAGSARTGLGTTVGRVACAAVAGGLGVALAGHGWAVVAVVGLAVLLGGMSKSTAELSVRFVTLMVIATGLRGDPLGVAVLAGGGAGWGALTGLLAGTRNDGPASVGTRVARWRGIVRLWWGRLGTWTGWQYAVRLALCLAVAEGIGAVWAQPSPAWIAVTVVIVVGRRADGALRRPLERAAGTAAGVTAGSAMLLWVPPPWALVPVVAVLAGVRPLLKERNYTLYAMVMTPLVLLLMQGGAPITPATIGYRLADTVIGCAVALAIGYLPWTIRKKAGRNAHAVVD